MREGKASFFFHTNLDFIKIKRAILSVYYSPIFNPWLLMAKKRKLVKILKYVIKRNREKEREEELFCVVDIMSLTFLLFTHQAAVFSLVIVELRNEDYITHSELFPLISIQGYLRFYEEKESFYFQHERLTIKFMSN